MRASQMHKFADWDPSLRCLYRASKPNIEILNKASVSPSLIRHILRISSNMALRCLKPSNPRPLASIRLVGRIGNSISRPFAGVTNIPSIGYEHPPDVPSERVLSRLSIFGQRRDEPHTHTERKQGTGWRSSEAQGKEKEEVQKTA